VSEIIVEIRAAEGGADAKDLVRRQLAIYAKTAALHNLGIEILDERPAQVVIAIRGRKAETIFAQEPGGHRWQRVPPTEKRGRVHTSTVTVAVLPVTSSDIERVDEREIEWKAVRGTGKGGQARNKTSNAVHMVHRPTGLIVRVESSRSQWANREAAVRILAARLADAERATRQTQEASTRRRQVGSGQRGDKVRTVRVQDNRVVDHRTEKRTTLERYERGHILDLSAA
jgi:peptide chain release factor 1